MSLFSKTVAERTRPGQRQDVEEQSYTFHAYARSEGVAGIIISDQEYPALVAHQLLGKVMDEFISKYPRTAWSGTSAAAGGLSFPQLKEYLTKYQDPQNADGIMKIQKELDETKIVLHKTIESVLERGRSRPHSFYHLYCHEMWILTSLRAQVRRLTAWWPRAMASALRARCSTHRPRSKTRAVR